MNYSENIRTYIDEEIEILRNIDADKISEVMNVLENTRLNGHRVFICGNGGSAATASHFTCVF